MKLLTLALALALLPQQDKITLKFNPKKGDKLIKTEKTEMQLKMKVTTGGQDQDTETETKESKKTVTEFADVVDGKVTKILIDCQEHVEEQKKPPMMEWEKSEKPMHGRKVTLSLKDAKLVRDGVEGLEEKELKKLDLEDRTSHLFPKQAVGAGDTWEVKGDDVRKFLGGGEDLKDGTIKMKLVEVKEIDKRKCAVMSAAFELKGKTDNDIEITLKLDTEVVIWIDRGYALSVKGKGTVTMKLENEQVKMAGEGPMTVDISTKIALALLPQQDKITLKFNPKKGDKLIKTEKTEMQLKMKVTTGGQDQDTEMETKESEKTVTEFADVVDGKVTKMLIDCQEHVEEQKKPPMMEWEKSEKPMHGRKVTLSLKDGKLVRDGVEGLEEKELKKLDLDDRTSHLFPKQAVGAGDTWEVKGDDVRKFLGGDEDLTEGTIKMKLVEVKEIDKRKCAVISAAFELKGKTDNDIEVTLKLDTEVVIWIDRGYALSVKGKGTMTMKLENDQVKLGGEGPMTLDISTKVE